MTTALAPPLPRKLVFVSHVTFLRLQEVARLFLNREIDNWEYAARCRRIEPTLEMFKNNYLVVID